MRIITAVLALLAGLVPAAAADVYSTKDTPSVVSIDPVASNVAGIYVHGHAGLYTGTRDVSRRIDRESGDVLPGTPDNPETPDVDESAPGLDVPLFQSFIDDGGSHDLEGAVFGGSVSYLLKVPSSRFGLEVGVNLDWYNDNETRQGFDGVQSTATLGTPPASLSSGHVTFQRDFDIDLVAKGHVFLSDRMSVYAGGGLSIAFANASGASARDGDFSEAEVAQNSPYATRFDDDQTSLGYVLLAGFQFWATDRLVIGGEYNYKVHDFDFSGGSRGLNVDGDYYRSATDRLDVEDEVHSFKVRAGYKLN
jgi:opacity protein-like surface antigen